MNAASSSSSSSPQKMYQQNTPTSLCFDALYCEEEQNWDNGTEIINDCLIEEQEPFSGLLCDDDKEELSYLLCKEQEYQVLYRVLVEDNAKARDEAVEWMFKVIGYYSFSALTALVAVNYLDRFVCTFQFQQQEKQQPWMYHLVAVACLSLAAKVEETQVPLLLDLQVEESKYVFESKTIQRMELLVLSTLKWKMNPVTPISFLDYIATRRLAFCKQFLNRCECLLLSLITDCRFMSHLPSALATATMLYVISSLEPCIAVEYQDQLINILGINKDKVEECCKLIQEVATSLHFQSGSKRKFGSLPYSPKGVVNISFSCEDSNDSWPLDSTASVSSSPEPFSKKIKTDHGIL